PAFTRISADLQALGYSADVFEASAETFGAPQTRRRVYLVAHRDRPVGPPPTTHQAYVRGVAPVQPVDMLGHLPWVSMAEAIGVGFRTRPALTLRSSSTSGGGHGMDGGSGARRAIARAIDRGEWHIRTNNRPNGKDYQRRVGSSPAPTLTTSGRIWHTPAGPLTAEQGCALMGFDPAAGTAICDLPTKRAQWTIIGNAVCPPVATAILETLIDP
ncbi:MAG: DNA cytosine methyltransferase, partial [Microthrixaceae bacterium]